MFPCSLQYKEVPQMLHVHFDGRKSNISITPPKSRPSLSL